MSDNAYEPLLSTDETDALLQAMRSNGAAVTTAKEVELGSTEHRLRKSLDRADDVARDWANEVRKLLRRMLGVSASVRESPADVIPYSVMAQSIAPGSAICVLQSEEGALGFLLIGPGLTTFVLNRRLGGGPDPKIGGQADDPRTFLSAVDRRIVRPFCEEVVAALVQCWGRDQVAVAVSEVLARPIDLPRLGQFEPLLRLPLGVSFGMDSNEELMLVLSGSAIQLPKVEEKTPEPVNTGDRERMAARLTFAELELVVVLGRAPTSVRHVLSLSVGDVLRLEDAPSAPLQIFVEGQKKMLGTPVVSHGNIAVEVIEVLKGGA